MIQAKEARALTEGAKVFQSFLNKFEGEVRNKASKGEDFVEFWICYIADEMVLDYLVSAGYKVTILKRTPINTLYRIKW